MVYYFEGKILVAYLLISLLFVAIATYKKKNNKITYAILCAVFCLYLFNVIKITQFPIYTGNPLDWPGVYWPRTNLVPFKDIINVTSIQNIIMTMPLGFLLPLVFSGKISAKGMLIVAFLSGVALESMQLLQMLVMGCTFRVIDVNDVILTFIGVMLGYLCFVLLEKIVQRLCARFDRWFAAQL